MTLFALVIVAGALNAQTPKDVKYVFTEASELNLIGKIHKDTPNPYHRVDTVKYKGFTVGENRQVRCPVGLAVLFKTNSTTISVKTEYGWQNDMSTTMPLSYRGYDLYIKDKGQWRWAAARNASVKYHDCNVVLISNMDGQEKECMLYLPIYSEVYSVKIGVQEGAAIESLESPFRHRYIHHTHQRNGNVRQNTRKGQFQYVSIDCHCARVYRLLYQIDNRVTKTDHHPGRSPDYVCHKNRQILPITPTERFFWHGIRNISRRIVFS